MSFYNKIKQNEVAFQGIKMSVYSYLGAFIGAFSTIVLVPILFSEKSTIEYWSVVQLIIADIVIFQVLALFSTGNGIVKFYSSFKSRHQKEEHLTFTLNIVFYGIIFSSLMYYVFFISGEVGIGNDLFNRYIWIFFPLLICYTLASYLMNYCRVISKIAYPTFIRDVMMKLWGALSLIMLYFNVITTDTFIYVYFSQYLLFLIFVFLYVKKNKEDRFRFNFVKLTKFRNEIKYLLFTIVSGSVAIIILKIDIKMISYYFDFENIAIYSMALYMISVLLIPMRSINSILQPVLSNKIQNNDEEFSKIYHKSNMSYFVVTSILFLSVFICINEIMVVLGPKYGQLKYVFIFLGFGKVVESIFYTNTTIISISKNYRWDFLIQLGMLIMVIILNLVLMPVLGINGCALASGITFIIGGLVKSQVVYHNYNLFPSINTLLKTVWFPILLSTFYFVDFNIGAFKQIIVKETLFFTLTITYFYFINLHKKLIIKR